jgi:carbon-monoxide dehydrogenase medium subunit
MERTSPGLPEFDYIKPDSLAQASQFMVEHSGRSRLLCGGTDIFVRMRDGTWQDQYLVDIKGLDGMTQLDYDSTRGLSIGAAVNMNQVIVYPPVKENYPVLVQAARSVASYQLRNRATIVGNICNASPAGDTTGACLLLGGALRVHGVNGVRMEALGEFFTGPGQTRLKAGDIVTHLMIPTPPDGLVGVYIKLGRNKVSDLAIVGLTAIAFPDASSASGIRFRLALASVAPVPFEVKDVEDFLSVEEIDETSLEKAAQLAMQACSPIDDTRASARYRSLMVRNLSYKALSRIWMALTDQAG